MKIKQEELRKHQLNLLEMLNVIDRICKECNISYVLFGGTLLGAIRHKGFIPWDNDVDIAMPREDFRRFQALAPERLPDFMELQSHATDQTCTSFLTRLRNHNTICVMSGTEFAGSRFHGAFIDIFPLDDVVHPGSLGYRCRSVLVKQVLHSLIERAGENNRESRSLKQKTGNLIARFRTREAWIVLRQKLAEKENGKEAQYFCNYGSHYSYRKQIFKKEKIFPAGKHVFEEKEFCVPADYDYVLKKFYGDHYMEPPSEKDKHLEDHTIFQLNTNVKGE
ncbi:MAG: LicD family protein [Clostridiaceae bacterium]|nr:LicD family protein [Clostridiaceae bacterium]